MVKRMSKSKLDYSLNKANRLSNYDRTLLLLESYLGLEADLNDEMEEMRIQCRFMGTLKEFIQACANDKYLDIPDSIETRVQSLYQTYCFLAEVLKAVEQLKFISSDRCAEHMSLLERKKGQFLYYVIKRKYLDSRGEKNMGAIAEFIGRLFKTTVTADRCNKARIEAIKIVEFNLWSRVDILSQITDCYNNAA